jgi:hypothetical protein
MMRQYFLKIQVTNDFIFQVNRESMDSNRAKEEYTIDVKG